MTDDLPPAAESSPPAAGPGQFARDNAALLIAGGLALGLLAGALMPKAARSKLARRTIAVAAAVGETGLAFSRQARERAGTAVQQGAGEIRRRAVKAKASTSNAGIDFAKSAIDLVSALRRR